MGDFTGTIVGIIVGLIILFLICRELVCWYYKINKITALLEEQISLLKMQVAFVPTHLAKSSRNDGNVLLREKPSLDYADIERLPSGTHVQFLEKKSNEGIGEAKETWFKVVTQEKTIGWCFSDDLEKLS